MSGSTLWWWVAGIAAAVGLIWWWSTSAGRMRAQAGAPSAPSDEHADRAADGGDRPGGDDRADDR